MEYGAAAEDVARVCHAHPVGMFFSSVPLSIDIINITHLDMR